jgi:hypothetical protein
MMVKNQQHIVFARLYRYCAKQVGMEVLLGLNLDWGTSYPD